MDYDLESEEEERKYRERIEELLRRENCLKDEEAGQEALRKILHVDELPGDERDEEEWQNIQEEHDSRVAWAELRPDLARFVKEYLSRRGK